MSMDDIADRENSSGSATSSFSDDISLLQLWKNQQIAQQPTYSSGIEICINLRKPTQVEIKNQEIEVGCCQQIFQI